MAQHGADGIQELVFNHLVVTGDIHVTNFHARLPDTTGP
jgi:hypothetical protein